MLTIFLLTYLKHDYTIKIQNRSVFIQKPADFNTYMVKSDKYCFLHNMNRSYIINQTGAIRMKPLKILKAFLPALLLCFAIAGCSGNQSKPPSELIIGNWEYRNQSWCEFYNDNTCLIGGTAGEYIVNDDNSITMSVYGSDEEQSFEWASGEENIDSDHWYVTEDTLYINGMQFPRTESTDEDSSVSGSTSDSEASGSPSEQ